MLGDRRLQALAGLQASSKKTNPNNNMSLVTYRPRRSGMPSLFNDDFVRTFFGPEAQWPTAPNSKFVPAVNVEESDEAYRLHFAVPGRKKEDLKVNVEANVLTVSYQEQKDQEQQTGKVHLREFARKSFSRSFQLPETVNAEQIQAAYTDGILTISLPKHPVAAAQARAITIA